MTKGLKKTSYTHREHETWLPEGAAKPRPQQVAVGSLSLPKTSCRLVLLTLVALDR